MSLPRATADADLTLVLTNVMSERVQSLAGLRGKIEELAMMQQEETERFVASMRSVFEKSRQSQSMSSPSVPRDHGLAAELEKERAERKKAVEIAMKFRQEGAKVMGELKHSLKHLQDEHAATSEENKYLRQQLAGKLPPSVPAVPPRCASDEKMQALVQLLEQQEEIIDKLNQKRRTAQRKLGEVTRERDALRKIDPGIPEGLLSEFRQSQRSPSSMPIARIRQLVEALLQRLHTEQAQRLHVEEQSAKIAAAQEEGLRRMESRLRELEGGTSSKGPVELAGHNHVDPPTALTPQLRVPQLTAVTAGSQRRENTNAPAAGQAPAGDKMPSLESQLQAVSSEFQDSLQQWQQVISQDAEFMPDSP